tara:strand:+ start:3454 stop:3831 length:378 start_codon:yes stop_codon:yes gene_type:complete
MTIPHIKLSDTMLNKYIIDAKKDVLEQMGIEPDQSDGVETWEDPTYRTAHYWFDVNFIFDIKFYMTTRGDKRMSIPELRKYANTGDYVWFEKVQDSENDLYIIHIGKELPVDKKEQYEQLQVRYG